MKNHLCVLGMILVLASTVLSQTAPPEPSAPLKHVGKAAELSANPGGLDTLGILSDDNDSSHDSDPKRAHLESTVFRREQPVEYAAGGRRDPFRALITDEKKGEEEVETDLLKLKGAILTGVVWAQGQYLALVRDDDGRNFFLRDGDPIYQGHVTLVTQSQASFEISDFGDYQKVVLKVRVKDDKGKAKDKG
jgi:hypothetical protein